MSPFARLTPVAAWILALSVGMFLLSAFAGETNKRALVHVLALTPAALADGQVWKLLTTALVSDRLLTLFFDGMMLWLFVPVLERAFGTRRFVRFVLATSVIGNLGAALVGLALAPGHLIIGLSPFIYASIAAFGVVFGDQPVQFFGVVPIRGRQLAIGMICFLSLFIVLERAWVDGAGYFAAMGLAWAMTDGLWQPNVWWQKLRRWRVRRRYTVIDGGEGGRRDKGRKRWMN